MTHLSQSSITKFGIAKINALVLADGLQTDYLTRHLKYK
jgi:hypothetical protein